LQNFFTNFLRNTSVTSASCEYLRREDRPDMAVLEL
jgi:hypothetical protein